MKTGAKICVALIVVFLLVALCFPLIAPQFLSSGTTQGVVTPAVQDAPYYLGVYELSLIHILARPPPKQKFSSGLDRFCRLSAQGTSTKA